MIKNWLEAARPRTLPTSISPVIAASAYAWHQNTFDGYVAVICLIFALLAQIASNLGNDYFDYKKGSDRADRVGPRRAVASGDISPTAMLYATGITLALACITGCLLIPIGGWELIVVGIFIAFFAIAYSAGPYPLSYHGLGDIAVFIFFGLIAVNFTFYVQALYFDWQVFLCSIAMGLLSVNILMVNNYRDKETDEASNKRTLVVIFGRKFAEYAYLSNGIIALLATYHIWITNGIPGYIAALLYLGIHLKTWNKLIKNRGTALNPVLGKTARNQLIFTLLLVLIIIIN